PGYADSQNPPAQTSTGAHCLKHPPQFSWSDVTSTQPPPQQTKGKMHRFPHAPQLFGSKSRSVQTLSQKVPVAQPHVPFTQCGAAGSEQTQPHAPQLLGSEARSTHVPPQSARPGGQTQTPLLQTLPPAQTRPHAPQL